MLAGMHELLFGPREEARTLNAPNEVRWVETPHGLGFVTVKNLNEGLDEGHDNAFEIVA